MDKGSLQDKTSTYAWQSSGRNGIIYQPAALLGLDNIV
jgi:hypothetical protein